MEIPELYSNLQSARDRWAAGALMVPFFTNRPGFAHTTDGSRSAKNAQKHMVLAGIEVKQPHYRFSKEEGLPLIVTGFLGNYRVTFRPSHRTLSIFIEHKLLRPSTPPIGALAGCNPGEVVTTDLVGLIIMPSSANARQNG